MKTTYLIYKQVDGVQQLVVATQTEWNAILKENKRLPLAERRSFIKDCFEGEDGLDCMYIEVSVSEHREWNSKNTVYQRKRKAATSYTNLSLDANIQDTEVDSLHECIPVDFDLEAFAMDEILIEELRQALRAWKPWAEELLELYMSGVKRSCTNTLCKKYSISERAVRKRKKAFEKFILDFLKK